MARKFGPAYTNELAPNADTPLGDGYNSDEMPIEGDAETPLEPIGATGGIDNPQDGDLGPPVDDPVEPIDNPYEGDLGPPVGLDGHSPEGGTVAPPPAPAASTDPLRAAVMSRLTGLLGGTGQPDLSAAIGAHRTGSQRAAERQRALLAERSAASGLGGSGALDAGIVGIDQDRGESDAAYEADLTQRGQDQQNQMIMQALGIASPFLGQQDALGLDASKFEANYDQDAIMRLLAYLSQQGQGAY
jgi:hypothetical protein